MAILLAEFQWFQNHPPPLIVVAHLLKPNQRKILPQGVTGKTVVSKDPPQIRMAQEWKAEQIPNFTLQPIGGRKNPYQAGKRSHTGRPKLEAEIKPVREQLIHQLEPGLPIRPIHSGQIHQRAKGQGSMEPEQGNGGNHRRRGNPKNELPLPEQKPKGSPQPAQQSTEAQWKLQKQPV